MKSNVDLTSNEIFSRNIISTKRIARYIKGMFLWTPPYIHKSDFDVDMQTEREVIFTGNKEIRNCKKLCEEEYSGEYCDCCGYPLNKKPWLFRYGLCKRCNNRVYKTKKSDKMPWYKNDDMKIKRGLNPLIW